MTLYQSIASTTLVDNTTKIVDLTVPNGKIWKIHSIMMHNGDDVARTLEAWVADSSNNILLKIGVYNNAGAGSRIQIDGYIPGSAGGYGVRNQLLIKGGNKLRLKWAAGGTSSGGTAYYCITYEEVPE